MRRFQEKKEPRTAGNRQALAIGMNLQHFLQLLHEEYKAEKLDQGLRISPPKKQN